MKAYVMGYLFAWVAHALAHCCAEAAMAASKEEAGGWGFAGGVMWLGVTFAGAALVCWLGW